MTATLQNLVDDCRSHIDEAVQQFWEDAELHRWINEALRDVARNTETLQRIKSYTIIANQLSYPAPDDMLRINGIEYRQTSSLIVPLEFVPFQTLYDVANTGREIPGAIPGWWSYWGWPGGQDTQIYVYPPATSTIRDGMRVFYYALPTPLTRADQVAEIPNGWEDLVPMYVECLCLRKARDPRYAEAHALYQERLAQMVQTTRQWSDQSQYISERPFQPRTPWYGDGTGW